MPNKRVILSIFAAALVFGVAVSGCNRDRDARVAMDSRRQGQQNNRQPRAEGRDRRKNVSRDRNNVAVASRTVRPAEVLSASAHRPARRSRPAAPVSRPYSAPYEAPSYGQPYIQAVSHGLAQAYEPLPEPIPVSELYRTQGYSGTYAAAAPSYPSASSSYASSYSTSTQPVFVSATEVAPMYASEPYVLPSSPELAMARASLEPVEVAAPVYYAPSMQPIQAVEYVQPMERPVFGVPIPELEPVRYPGVAVQQPVQAPAPLPVALNSGRQGAPVRVPEKQRALAPLPQPQGWVPSPATTAMRTARY